MCLLTEIMQEKKKKFEITENPRNFKIEQIRQNLYNTHKSCTKGTVVTAKPAEKVTNAQLASVSIVDWVIFLRKKTKRTLSGGKLNSCTNRNYVLIDYVLSETVKYVSQCDLTRGFCSCKPKLRVNRVLNENDFMILMTAGSQTILTCRVSSLRYVLDLWQAAAGCEKLCVSKCTCSYGFQEVPE